MKRFKIGFLAIVALMAMSFTMAGAEDLFKNVKDSGTCNDNVDKSAATYFTGTGEDNCSGTTAALACPSTGLNKFVATFTTQTEDNFSCDGTNTTFCCAELSSAVSCTPDAGSQPKVSKIICGERN